MRRVWLWTGLVGTAVVGLAALAILNPWIHFVSTVSTCRADNQIEAQTRSAADREAMTFVTGLLGTSSATAYAELSTGGRAAVTRDQFDTAARQVRADRPTGPPVVSRTLFAEGVFVSHVLTSVPCSFSHDSEEAVIAEDASKEAHVLLTQAEGYAQRTFDVWVVLEHGQWRVNGFTVHLSQIAGWDGEALWARAKQQRARGHMFNAAELYGAAAETLNGGLYYQSPLWNEFQKDYQTFNPPPEFKGKAPYKWVLGGQTYPVNGVSFIGTGKGQVVLLIYQPSEVWKGDADADRRNRQTIQAFIAAHPEWTETFEAISVRSAKPDNNGGWGTVYEQGNGYVGKSPAADGTRA
jgi:hypothetical protein